MAWGFNSRQDDFLNEIRSMFEQAMIANANMVRAAQVETSMRSNSEELQKIENELNERKCALEQKQEELTQLQLDLEHRRQELEIREAQLKEQEQALAADSESLIEGDWSKFYHLLEGMKQDVAEIVRRDELMKSLHTELQQHNRNLYAEITKPQLLHLVNVHKRMLETYQYYEKLSVEEYPEVYKKLLEAIIFF